MAISAFLDEKGNRVLDQDLTPEREARLAYKAFSEKDQNLADKILPQFSLEKVFRNLLRKSWSTKNRNKYSISKGHLDIISFGDILRKYTGPKMNLIPAKAYACLEEVRSYFKL